MLLSHFEALRVVTRLYDYTGVSESVDLYLPTLEHSASRLTGLPVRFGLMLIPDEYHQSISEPMDIAHSTSQPLLSEMLTRVAERIHPCFYPFVRSKVDVAVAAGVVRPR